jgi:hypothetical protein
MGLTIYESNYESFGPSSGESVSGDYGDLLHTKSDNPTPKTHQRSP